MVGRNERNRRLIKPLETKLNGAGLHTINYYGDDSNITCGVEVVDQREGEHSGADVDFRRRVQQGVVGQDGEVTLNTHRGVDVVNCQVCAQS